MAAEEVLFQQGHARVTTTKVQIGGTTYPLSGITSVSTKELRETPLPQLGLLFGGTAFLLLALLILSNDAVPDKILANLFGAAGVATMAIGLIWLRSLGARYAVVLGTAGSERAALVTRDQTFATAVRDAVEQAITRRG